MSKNLLLALLFCTCFRLAAAQQSNDGKTVPVFFEKVYLHTDRDVYGQGEDIWFKAYLVNAEYNTAIYSHNLYVELIAPNAKILSRRAIRLENGLGNGDFKLTDSIPTGTYRLRAYTNWMRNFGDNFIFEKNIRVLNVNPASPVTAAATKKKINPVIPSAVVAATADTPIVRFFPEGGSMLNGVSGIVAVKAEDGIGRGITVKGKITNSAGTNLTEFSCDSLGFGSFVLKPVAGQHYKAQVSIRGQQHSFPLPEIRASGFNLALNHNADTLIATVSCNAQTFTQSNGQHLYLTAKHGSKTYVSKVLPINSAINSIKMPDSWLPEGIACVTITDENTKPLAERLVYVHHPGGVKLKVSTDRTVYHPSGAVSVDIRLNTKQKANLSVAVVDAGTVPVQEGDIVSYLNLQSEIKGRIENPNRYFDTTNVNRFKQLDLLLLTQGWRDFIWKQVEDTTLKLAYEPEQGINITGKVRKVWTKGALKDINITMRAPRAQGQKLFWAITDSAGRFAIYNTQFYGYQYMSFTARRADKINRDGQSKGKTSGWLQVDSLWQDTLPAKPLITEQLPDTALTGSDAQDIISLLKKSLNLKADHNLKEVTILSKRQGTAISTVTYPITLAVQKEYGNLSEYLVERIPEAKVIYHTCTYCSIGGDRPDAMFLDRVGVRGVYADKSPIDYCYVCQEDYLMQPMSNILKVTITESTGWGGASASVNVVMRPGALEPKDAFDNTIADMIGYYQGRVFYKPDPENPESATDQRINTIYWEPNLITNANGQATLEFNNTLKTGNLRVIVEGLSDKGDAVAAVANYKVE